MIAPFPPPLPYFLIPEMGRRKLILKSRISESLKPIYYPWHWKFQKVFVSFEHFMSYAYFFHFIAITSLCIFNLYFILISP